MSVAVAVTDTPWALGVDALVVSVGGSLGDLGVALAQQFTDFAQAVGRIKLSRIPSRRPRMVELTNVGSLRFVVLASPHGDGGDVSLGSVREATRAAILTADRERASGVAIPLLATGVLGLSRQDVAAVVVPAVVDALRMSAARGLRRVVLFGREPEIVDVVQRQWLDSGLPVAEPASQAVPPGTAVSGETAGATSLDPAGVGPSDVSDGVSDDLAGGVSSDLVDHAKPIAMERDRLGVGTYVSMLATVIAERATPTPLSIGVFGDWGAGKSFFMGMLRGRIDELAGSGSPKYCHRVVQIGFNAWHYADTNLWASLADVIFRGLAEPDPGPERQRSELQRVLAEKVDRRVELAEVNQRAEAEVARLKAKVDEADGEHVTGARDLLAAMRESTQLSERLDRVWKRIGVTDEVEQGKLLSQQLRDAHADADTLRRLPRDRNGKMALAAAGVVLGVSAAAALAVPLITWLGGAVSLVLAALGGGLLARARNGLGELRAMSEDIRGGLDRIHEERVREHVAETVEQLRKAEADHLVAQAQLDEVVTHVGELGRQLADLNPAHRMSAFVTERAGGDTYTRDLGVVSTLRKDFEQLVRLLADWRANPDADPEARPIDRVVLHIDDLDRCEPRQVVQVMEAVHLLLAMDLFVVVVGVDPRWLVGSLRNHYAGVLHDADTTASPWRVLPEDYLEKIINIPFTLPGMAEGGLGSVLRSMVEVDTLPATRPEAPRPAPPGQEPPAGLTGLAVEPGAPLDSPTRAPAPARPLTEAELAFLDALEPLVDTPRAAKRLLNVYRMIRATRDLSEAARFLGDDDRPGEFQAVIVLLGIIAVMPSLSAAVLGAPPDSAEVRGGLVHRDPSGQWASFAADLLPRDGRSPIVGTITAEEATHWLRLHHGLQTITDMVTLPDLTVFQTWVPHVRRFSYSNH
ncbi:P-loop NTPase fold protein [Saccharothrix sp. ALI-22-I]|uniref:P-loop NTPase fold protein n=1 Tax=Saccharothrix sp. ALI-22-I TaxID=1933778 RepID=UPI00097C2845|nr:P-loop NTPase fold protein [Saccharothrix sp. ALI-22-I]